MTFIASVIAKNGVAIIADSLVTTSRATISANDFFNYVSKKSSQEHDAEGRPVEEHAVLLNVDEIIALFRKTTSHTKDFEEKLYKYETYTAITTAGAASINDKRIEQIIHELIGLNSADPDYEKLTLQEKVDGFVQYVTNEIKEQLIRGIDYSGTNFLITNYNPATRKSTIFRIVFFECEEEDVKDEEYEYYRTFEVPESDKIACDGQNRISDRILYGEMDTFAEIIPYIVAKVFKDHKIEEDSQIYSRGIMKEILGNKKYIDDMKMYQLSELSLQQAVDLAYLLMRIEMDIQKYTRNIPTVGGVIKCAVIDSEGFKFISGKDIKVRDFLK